MPPADPLAKVGDVVRIKRGAFKINAAVIAVADRGIYIRDSRKRLLFFMHEEYELYVV